MNLILKWETEVASLPVFKFFFCSAVLGLPVADNLSCCDCCQD